MSISSSIFLNGACQNSYRLSYFRSKEKNPLKIADFDGGHPQSGLLLEKILAEGSYAAPFFHNVKSVLN